MTPDKLALYVIKTRAYLATDEGRANFRHAQEAYGYSYQRALCAAVMHVTGLVLYTRITEVVKTMMSEEVAAAIDEFRAVRG